MTYPAPGGGYSGPGAPPPLPQGPQLSDHVNDLVWIKVLHFDPAAQFPWGVKPALTVDLEVINGRSEVGVRHTGIVLSNVLLVKQLNASIGQEMFGRISEQKGQNANAALFLGSPWPGDEQFVQAFLAKQRPQNGQHAPQPPQGQASQAGPPQGYQPPPAQPQAQPQPSGYGQPPVQPTPAYGQPSNYPTAPPVPDPAFQGMPPAAPPAYGPPPF